MINHIRIWNRWRKHSLNSKFHKLFVLLNIASSPTFEYEKAAYNVNLMRDDK